MCSAKLAVVTGSNKGIGYAAVKGLCEKFDGDVYLTARDAGRGREAVKSLNAVGLMPKFHRLDVTDDGSVAEFKSFVERNYAGVDVLVNNAAVLYREDSPVPLAAQAAETCGVNYFGTRRVCDALFPLLSTGARVVNVSSCSGLLSRIPGDGLKAEFSSPDLTAGRLDGLVGRFVDAATAGNHVQLGWPPSAAAYVVTKVSVSALTRIQQKAFDVDPRRKDVIVNSVHPGYVDTDMTSHMVGLGVVPLTTDQGAEPIVYLALLPAGEQRVKGQYVWYDNTVKNWCDFHFVYK